ncbi:oxaloacetate decarboxylase [Amycolatopsis thermalba]|uniref:Oxaloacetate decarboxylase n=1 Tax=Amycolatopsis thermalba TaxID=944492 RepID=A0ABY4NXN4_9PSEU|nr:MULTISPECIES: oxaloacetate decarboxylase [Amycolatopsis]UQS24840.1 oxaloacetate decarboxylase [Amycolatopsis thermalba]
MGDLLGRGPEPRKRLRELLAAPGPLVAPGAYDALTARLIEQAGFGVVYMTGFGTTASLIGRPDVGLLTGTEMIDNARRIVAAVDVPVIADADTGYGNALNVIRTVQAYEQAGVAGIHLEDQVSPKKCGHLSGKAVIAREEMVGKLRAAVAARRDPDFVLIARTDAAAVHGLADAIGRARAYAAAGADLLFVELGFALVLYPIGTLLAATAGVRALLETVRADGTPAAALPGLPSFGEFTGLVGLPEVSDLERRFGGESG